MSFLFGKRKTPAELLRENKRMLDESIREIERERQSLQNQEKKLILEIMKTAKQGQMGAVKVVAKDLEMLKEQEIGSSPDHFLSVQAANIDPCLTHEQKREACRRQGLSVSGFNVNGTKWTLQLRKVNETYFFIEETRNKMTVVNGWEQGTEICIWGVPDGRFTDGNVCFLFTNGI